MMMASLRAVISRWNAISRSHNVPGVALRQTLKGAQLEQAVTTARDAAFDSMERSWIDRIEAIRQHLLASEERLASWERPWLAHSPELQARLRLRPDAGSYETSVTIADACKASKPPSSCRLLLALTRQLRPRSVVEMGTNIGISGVYIAAGLELNGSGRLVTLEGAPSKAALAEAKFRELGLRAEIVIGDFALTLRPALEELATVELAFIDGFHEGTATLRYHSILKQYAPDGAVLAYDDIRWSKGMARAWQQIQNDSDVELALDLGDIGLCVLGRKQRRQPLRLKMSY